MKTIALRDENGKLYYGWIIVVMAALFCGLVYSGIVSVTGVFIMPVTMELELPIAGYSFYLTIMSIANILTLLFISKQLNPKNIKKIMIIAGILGIISFIGFAMAKSLMWFYIFAVPQGFCFGAFTMTPCQILVSNWFGEKARGRAMSIFLTGMSLVTVALMNVLNYFVMNQGWRTGYIAMAIIVAVCVLIAIKGVVWSPAEKGINRIGDMEEAEAAAMMNREIKGVAFADALKKPITWLAFISCTLAVIVSSSILQHGIPTIVMGTGMDQTAATGIISAMSLVMIVTGPLVGIICDKFKLSIAAAGTCLFFAASTLGLAYMGAAWAMPVYIVGYIFGVPAINIVTPLMMGHMYGEKDLNRLIGYANVFIGVGGAIGATAVGVLVQTYDTYYIPWLVMTGVLLVVAVIRGICTTEKRKFKEAA